VNDSAEKFDPRFRQKLFFWCCAVVSLVALLGRNSLFWVEPRIAEAAREIAATGRWYPLTINFREFSGLPMLEVWSVALLFKLGVSEFAARLPSALAALALLIGTMQLTKRLFDRKTALLTGWLTLGSFGVLYMGRCCGSGVLSGALTIWAMVLFQRGVGRNSFWMALGMFSLLALGALNRGMSFLWLPAALMAPWILANRSRFSWRVAGAAALAALGLYLAWLLIMGEPFSLLARRLWRIMAVEGVWTALRRWCGAWWFDRATPLWSVFPDVFSIMLPWSLLMIAAFIGALCRMRTLQRWEKCIWAGIVLGFLVLAFPASVRRTDFLPLVPFLALETGVWVLRGEGGRLSRWAVVATRAAIVLAASFAAVALITAPVWRVMLGLELPMLFWTACSVFGGAVLLIMLLHSSPKHPLPKLTGLPDPLGSMILGGTLASICLLSFLLPSLREMREEKQFMISVRSRVAGIAPERIVNIGGPHSTSLLLFYADLPGRITTVSDRSDGVPGFVRATAPYSGQRIAVIAPYHKSEPKFLKSCAEAAKLDIDIEKPDLLEGVPGGYPFEYRQRALWLTGPGGTGSEKNTQTTGKHSIK
jgi:4-amino-4-deoxy-L-arabinose transferase-like glycosyltransferase